MNCIHAAEFRPTNAVPIFELSNAIFYRKQNKEQRDCLPADATTSQSTLYAIHHKMVRLARHLAPGT